jgi:hypothetical protein
MAEGLSFFLTTSGQVELTLASREKEKLESMFREKVNALLLLVSTWQRSRHLVARAECSPSVAAIVIIAD